jgi:hypothetical protein
MRIILFLSEAFSRKRECRLVAVSKNETPALRGSASYYGLHHPIIRLSNLGIERFRRLGTKIYKAKQGKKIKPHLSLTPP